MELENLYALYRQYPCVCTDTRQIRKDALFFCLKGENFDGNTFAAEALEQGAAYVVVDNPQYVLNERCLLVEDVLHTLQQLAHFHRRQLSVPIIGVTGTNGKTTTKELLTAVLSRKYRVTSTQGNLNNHIGVPLTLLSIRPDTEIAVVEMGANHPGEIATLCQWVEPDFGLITNIGKAHLEGFGTYEEIIRTKTALYRSVASRRGMLFVHADDSLLMRQAENLASIPDLPSLLPWYLDHGFGPDWQAGKRNIALYTYGSSEEANCQGCLHVDGLYLSFDLQAGESSLKVDTRLVGQYNFDNAMAACAVGRFFKVDDTDIMAALQAYTPSNSRSQILEKANVRIVMDAYNANPSSMEQALHNFARVVSERKILVLGDMRELGVNSVTEHQKIVEWIEDAHFMEVFLLGEEFAKTTAPESWKFKDMESLKQALRVNLDERPVLLLVKGSRGMRMERVLEIFG